MIKGFIKEIDWEYIGAFLANSPDFDQVAFFQGFVKEGLSWGTYLQFERQLAMVNGALTDKEKETLKMLSYKDGD